MRTWLAGLLIILSVHHTAGAPTYTRKPVRSTSPDVVAAERAWNAAEAETDAHAAAAAWRAAARTFDKATAAAGTPVAKELAYAAVLAWQNSLMTDTSAPPPLDPSAPPSSLTADEAAMVKSFDVYLTIASVDEAPGLLFARANVLHRHNRWDEARVSWIQIVTKHPKHETAELAANLILDTLVRQAKLDDLADWVKKLRANRRLVAHRPQLVATLTSLHVQFIRKRAEVLEAAGRAGDRAAYKKAGQLYQEAFDANPAVDRSDELLYNAAVCFDNAGATTEAIKIYRKVVARFPKSKLAKTARSRILDMNN